MSKYPRSKLSTSSPPEAAAGHWQCSTCEDSNHLTTQHHYNQSRSKLRGIKPKGNKKVSVQILVVHALMILFTACGVDRAEPVSRGDSAEAQQDRPNILWISLEDIGPMMGCYGDEYARTPVFDSLAAEGIRYAQAHSITPVCSTSWSSIITGMYPSSLGTRHHRSNVGQPPAFVKMLPNLMREALVKELPKA